MSLKLGINIYPTYLDGGSQPHLNHEVIRKEPAMTLAYQEAAVARDYGGDGDHNCEGEIRDLMILESPP
jgi:hypothetical protein